MRTIISRSGPGRAGSIIVTAVVVAAVVGLAACSPSTSASSSAPTAKSSAAAGEGSGRVASDGQTALAPAAGQTSGAPGAMASQAAAIGTAVTPATADIVENGRLDVQLRSPAALRSAYHAIQALAGAAGGFVSASTLTNAKVPSASMTLRVPNRSAPAVTDRIAALGRVTRQTMSGQDVTGQVIDLAVEITNLTSEEAAVRHLLSDAGSVHNILAVQQQLFALQDEIQELTAQSNSLDNRIQYATVAVALSTPPAVTRTSHHHTTTLARFGHLAVSHTVGLSRSVFLAIGWSAPGLVLVLVVGGALLAVRHRRRAAPPAPAGPAAS